MGPMTCHDMGHKNLLNIGRELKGTVQVESNDIECQLTEFIGILFIFHLSRLSLYFSLLDVSNLAEILI